MKRRPDRITLKSRRSADQLIEAVDDRIAVEAAAGFIVAVGDLGPRPIAEDVQNAVAKRRLRAPRADGESGEQGLQRRAAREVVEVARQTQIQAFKGLQAAHIAFCHGASE